MTHVRFWVVTGLLLAATIFGPQARVDAQQLAGQGKWQSLLGGELISGTWSLSLQRSAAKVTGTMQITGSDLLKTGAVTGTIDGSNVVLGVGSDGVTSASFNGQLTGSAISGEWDCPAVKDHGVWEGTLSARQ
ncbi:MAG: hypothetical protein ACHQ9S_18680 [Candidatus Binatia bacterium]